MDEKELVELDMSLGLYIRSEFGLWFHDTELIGNCCSVVGKQDLRSDSVSSFILKKLWEELRKTHLLRVIK